jgi:hypothetical protein
MGDAFIVRRGVSRVADTNAVLTVTCPTGSTVTMTKGSVTRTPTMWVKAADAALDCALFVLMPSLFDSENAWTVTAAVNGQTASGAVTIGTNKAYELRLGKFTLYDRGILADGYSYATSGSSNNYKIDTTSLLLKTTDVNYGRIAVTPAIDFTNISKIRFNIYRDGGAIRGAWVGISNETNTNTAVASLSLQSATAIGALNNGEWKELDVSAVSGNRYVELYSDTTYGNSMNLRVYGIELMV